MWNPQLIWMKYRKNNIAYKSAEQTQPELDICSSCSDRQVLDRILTPVKWIYHPGYTFLIHLLPSLTTKPARDLFWGYLIVCTGSVLANHLINDLYFSSNLMLRYPCKVDHPGILSISYVHFVNIVCDSIFGKNFCPHLVKSGELHLSASVH